VDRRAIEELKIPGIVLMENAAINAAATIRDLVVRQLKRPPRQTKVAIVCGGGNNGGDGYAIARHLHNRGIAVTIAAGKDPAELRGDAAINHAIGAAMGLSIQPATDKGQIEQAAVDWRDADVVVDALLGTGFTGEVRQPQAMLIDQINGADAPTIVAVDTPSGLDCQSGEAASHAVRADLTITFVAEKTGFDVTGVEAYTGRVVVADIGVPPELIGRVQSPG
jgi:NAD(P)H-hydrate epimerase